ncbi:MAG: choline binding protein nonfunctional [Candidatus Saccharibacteria bacterium]|nr:choline binding protein nonfunctional [Candidatus Saccharibacteria bacterium]
MKLRTTTPASHSKLNRVFKGGLISLFAIVFAFATIHAALPTYADEYDDKIASLQADMAVYQAESDRLNGEAATLQNALAQLANEKAAIQKQVDLSQAQYDKLVIDIANTEKQIKENQDGLGSTLADLYVDGEVSPLEMLASSSNISDFLNKQEYQSSVRDQLASTIKTVKDLKTKLSSQKADVEKVLTEQKAARDALVAKETEQQNLLNQTQNSESNYQGLISSSQQQITEAKATQAAIRARINGSGGYVLIDAGSLSAYPWNNSNCAMWGYLSTGGADGNGGDGYGYGCRQCASYAAWRIAKETGVYYRWGNAVEFTQNAKNAGYQEGAPMPGSIAVMDPAKAGQGYGHVAWVEAVNGNMVTVSQYNYDYGQGYGMYSMMTLSASAFDHYVKIK